MPNVKCHVFVWSTNCYHCSPHDYYEFESGFRKIVCPLLIKYIGVEAMDRENRDDFVETANYGEDTKADFLVRIPVQHYDKAEFDAISDEIDYLADKHFGGWESEQSDDDSLFLADGVK